MKKCSQCELELQESDLNEGVCPGCGQSLNPESIIEDDTGEQDPWEEWGEPVPEKKPRRSRRSEDFDV